MLLIGATPASAGITEAVASRGGDVIVKALAEPNECENADEQTAWEYEVPLGGQKGTMPPCGGRFALLARAPQVVFGAGHLRLLPSPCGKLPTITEFWNRQTPTSWYLDQLRGTRFERHNPPLHVAWMSEPVVDGNGMQPLTMHLHLRYRLWPAGMLETPCLYLIYLSRVEGSEPQASCLEGFTEAIRNEVCAQTFWKEVWVERHGRIAIPTAFQRCGGSEHLLEQREAIAFRFLRHHRGRNAIPHRMRRQILGALHRVEVNCPKKPLA